MSDSSDSETSSVPEMDRELPNILVTGTPGTGKTTTSELIAQATGLEHINVGEFVKSKQLYEGYLEEFDTHILDEDKVRSNIAHQASSLTCPYLHNIRRLVNRRARRNHARRRQNSGFSYLRDFPRTVV